MCLVWMSDPALHTLIITFSNIGHCVSLCIRGLQCIVPSLDLRLSLTSMDLSQLEQAYTDLGRVLQANKMCQGKIPFDPNPGHTIC